MQLLGGLIFDVNAWFPDCNTTTPPLSDGQPSSNSVDATPVEVTPRRCSGPIRGLGNDSRGRCSQV